MKLNRQIGGKKLIAQHIIISAPVTAVELAAEQHGGRGGAFVSGGRAGRDRQCIWSGGLLFAVALSCRQVINRLSEILRSLEKNMQIEGEVVLSDTCCMRSLQANTAQIKVFVWGLNAHYTQREPVFFKGFVLSSAESINLGENPS